MCMRLEHIIQFVWCGSYIKIVARSVYDWRTMSTHTVCEKFVLQSIWGANIIMNICLEMYEKFGMILTRAMSILVKYNNY